MKTKKNPLTSRLVRVKSLRDLVDLVEDDTLGNLSLPEGDLNEWVRPSEFARRRKITRQRARQLWISRPELRPFVIGPYFFLYAPESEERR